MHQQLRTFSKVFQEHIQLGYITPPRPPKQLRFWNTKTSIQKTKNLYSSHKSTPQPHISGVHASLKLHTLSHSDRNPGPKQKTEPSSNDYRGHKRVSMQTQSAFLFSALYNQKSFSTEYVITYIPRSWPSWESLAPIATAPDLSTPKP